MAATAKMVRMTSFLNWHYHSVGHAILGAFLVIRLVKVKTRAILEQPLRA